MTDKKRLRYNGKNRENAFINYRIKGGISVWQQKKLLLPVLQVLWEVT